MTCVSGGTGAWAGQPGLPAQLLHQRPGSQEDEVERSCSLLEIQQAGVGPASAGKAWSESQILSPKLDLHESK